jgi:hypothetical protein
MDSLEIKGWEYVHRYELICYGGVSQTVSPQTHNIFAEERMEIG